MDTTFLDAARQPLDQDFIDRTAQTLRDRGYTDNEISEIEQRAHRLMVEAFGPHPVTGEVFAFRRDYSAAVSEVLGDSADIAAGLFA